MPGRPVTRRASLSAPSIASEPEFMNMTESSGVGERRREVDGEARDRFREPDRVDRSDQPVDLLVDRRRDARMDVTERRDGDPVREVEVRLAVRVVQPVADAVAPRALEIAAQDRGEVRFGQGRRVDGGVGRHGRQGSCSGYARV